MKHINGLGKISVGLLTLALLTACSSTLDKLAYNQNSEVLIIGDSRVVGSTDSPNSVSGQMARHYEEKITSIAVAGANLKGRDPDRDIATLYQNNGYTLLIISPAMFADDIRTVQCDEARQSLDTMISRDGRRGTLPRFLTKVARQNINAIWLIVPPLPHNSVRLDPICRDLRDNHLIRLRRLMRYAGDGVSKLHALANVGIARAEWLFEVDNADNYRDDGFYLSEQGKKQIGQSLVAMASNSQRGPIEGLSKPFFGRGSTLRLRKHQDVGP